MGLGQVCDVQLRHLEMIFTVKGRREYVKMYLDITRSNCAQIAGYCNHEAQIYGYLVDLKSPYKETQTFYYIIRGEWGRLFRCKLR